MILKIWISIFFKKLLFQNIPAIFLLFDPCWGTRQGKCNELPGLSIIVWNTRAESHLKSLSIVDVYLARLSNNKVPSLPVYVVGLEVLLREVLNVNNQSELGVVRLVLLLARFVLIRDQLLQLPPSSHSIVVLACLSRAEDSLSSCNLFPLIGPWKYVIIWWRVKDFNFLHLLLD